MLVHICCAVDSHYFLQKIKEEYPDEKLTGFFYDPNIHPYNEYRLRFLDVQYSCKKLGIELLEGEYNLDEWLNKVKGLENEPEKGDRCTVCFDDRLEVSVKKAIELGDDKFTSTLLISPKKSQDKLERIGAELSSKYDCEFIFKDYRSGSGTQIQGEVVKENSLYRQNYCGCLYGLTQQRDHQDKLMDEMISPISNQILPESIEERLELYMQRNKLEDEKKRYKVVKQRFLNYRLLSGKVKADKKVIPSYILFYSTLRNKKANGRIEFEKDNIHYLNRDEIKILDIKNLNTYLNTNYNTTLDLIYNPPEIKKELLLRENITGSKYDLSTIIIVDTVQNTKYELEVNTKIYEDVKEVII